MHRYLWTLMAMAVLCTVLCAIPPCFAQSKPEAPAPANQAQLLQQAEKFLRQLYAWGPDVQLTFGAMAPSAAAGFYALPMQVTVENQAQKGLFYISKDGKTLLQGDLFDMSADPFAENRAKLHIEGNPAKGPDDAKVTLVEFADFQCPHCRELYQSLKEITAQYPQVRIVYKDFPIAAAHPWADTAAVGGRCAFDQSPGAFWKVHDMIFDNQDVISTENVWDKLVSFASAAGLNTDTFKACLSSPDAQKAIDANREEGIALGVNSTPTVYINGRPIVGGNPAMIMRTIAFELAARDAGGKN